jgi:hypothetical protein
MRMLWEARDHEEFVPFAKHLRVASPAVLAFQGGFLQVLVVAFRLVRNYVALAVVAATSCVLLVEVHASQALKVGYVKPVAHALEGFPYVRAETDVLGVSPDAGPAKHASGANPCVGREEHKLEVVQQVPHGMGACSCVKQPLVAGEPLRALAVLPDEALEPRVEEELHELLARAGVALEPRVEEERRALLARAGVAPALPRVPLALRRVVSHLHVDFLLLPMASMRLTLVSCLTKLLVALSRPFY